MTGCARRSAIKIYPEAVKHHLGRYLAWRLWQQQPALDAATPRTLQRSMTGHAMTAVVTSSSRRRRRTREVDSALIALSEHADISEQV